MKTKLLLAKIAFLLIFIFTLQPGYSQVNSQLNNSNTKTVVYKIKKIDEQKGLSTQMVIDIDKLLASKKGIISSNTNGATRVTTVKMEANFPEGEIAKALGNIFKLEIESYELIDNSK